jgi:hypothetical protein
MPIPDKDKDVPFLCCDDGENVCCRTGDDDVFVKDAAYNEETNRAIPGTGKADSSAAVGTCGELIGSGINLHTNLEPNAF